MSDMSQVNDWPVRVAVREQLVLAPNITHIPAGIHEGALRLRTSRFKRLIDLVGAGMGVLILSPFLLLIALAIAVESEGPVFFRQRRSGLDGKQFMIYKFRTMRVMEDGADVMQATRDDYRVTRLGKVLRRSSFDELPQLLNVLKGEMSLVGPRPHAVAHDDYYLQTVPTYHLRFYTTPGITGLAQVLGYRGEVRDIPHMEARVAKDLEYIENWSLVSDIRILLRTVVCAAFHEKAY